MVEEEKWRGPIDPESGNRELPEASTRRSHAWLVLAGMLSVLAFLAYTKTPYHINNCVHHIKDHIHLAPEVPIPAAFPPRQSPSQQLATPILHEKRAVEADNKTEVCTSPTCVTYAKQIRVALAKNYTKVDPCEDFNLYACQGWTDSHDWRPDQSCK
jgi:hypothetical protein